MKKLYLLKKIINIIKILLTNLLVNLKLTVSYCIKAIVVLYLIYFYFSKIYECLPEFNSYKYKIFYPILDAKESPELEKKCRRAADDNLDNLLALSGQNFLDIDSTLSFYYLIKFRDDTEDNLINYHLSEQYRFNSLYTYLKDDIIYQYINYEPLKNYFDEEHRLITENLNIFKKIILKIIIHYDHKEILHNRKVIAHKIFFSPGMYRWGYFDLLDQLIARRLLGENNYTKNIKETEFLLLQSAEAGNEQAYITLIDLYSSLDSGLYNKIQAQKWQYKLTEKLIDRSVAEISDIMSKCLKLGRSTSCVSSLYKPRVKEKNVEGTARYLSLLYDYGYGDNKNKKLSLMWYLVSKKNGGHEMGYYEGDFFNMNESDRNVIESMVNQCIESNYEDCHWDE